MYSFFKGNMSGASLAEIHLICKHNERFRFSSYATYTLKDKKGATITNAFQKVLNEPGRKQNKVCVNKGSEFYKRSMRSWLQDNDIEMYAIYNERKSVIAERFMKTSKNEIYKYLTSISKNAYIDKHNNTYHRTIKMKPVDVKSNTYIDFNVKKM